MSAFGFGEDALFGGEEDWQAVSGYVPMIRAEYRLRNLRRLARPLMGLHNALMVHLERVRSEYLAAVESDDEARTYRYEAWDASEEELDTAKGDDDPARWRSHRLRALAVGIGSGRGRGGPDAVWPASTEHAQPQT
jgi:hypothetical protein